MYRREFRVLGFGRIYDEVNEIAEFWCRLERSRKA